MSTDHREIFQLVVRLCFKCLLLFTICYNLFVGGVVVNNMMASSDAASDRDIEDEENLDSIVDKFFSFIDEDFRMDCEEELAPIGGLDSAPSLPDPLATECQVVPSNSELDSVLEEHFSFLEDEFTPGQEWEGYPEVLTANDLPRGAKKPTKSPEGEAQNELFEMRGANRDSPPPESEKVTKWQDSILGDLHSAVKISPVDSPPPVPMPEGCDVAEVRRTSSVYLNAEEILPVHMSNAANLEVGDLSHNACFQPTKSGGGGGGTPTNVIYVDSEATGASAAIPCEGRLPVVPSKIAEGTRAEFVCRDSSAETPLTSHSGSPKSSALQESEDSPPGSLLDCSDNPHTALAAGTEPRKGKLHQPQMKKAACPPSARESIEQARAWGVGGQHAGHSRSPLPGDIQSNEAEASSSSRFHSGNVLGETADSYKFYSDSDKHLEVLYNLDLEIEQLESMHSGPSISDPKSLSSSTNPMAEAINSDILSTNESLLTLTSNLTLNSDVPSDEGHSETNFTASHSAPSASFTLPRNSRFSFPETAADRAQLEGPAAGSPCAPRPVQERIYPPDEPARTGRSVPAAISGVIRRSMRRMKHIRLSGRRPKRKSEETEVRRQFPVAPEVGLPSVRSPSSSAVLLPTLLAALTPADPPSPPPQESAPNQIG